MIPRTAIGRILATFAMLILLAVISGVCQGCATTSDIDRIRARIAAVAAVVDEAQLDCAKLDAVAAELAQTEAETERLAEQARERAWTTTERIAGILLTLTGLGGTGWAATKAAARRINAERDARRIERGEPT